MLAFLTAVGHGYANAGLYLAHTATVAAPYLLAGLTDMIWPLAGLVAATALPMAHPRTRRATMAIMHFAKRHAPKWLAPLLVVCAFVPGPLDELLVIAAALYPVLRSDRNRRVFFRTVRYAFNAGTPRTITTPER